MFLYSCRECLLHQFNLQNRNISSLRLAAPPLWVSSQEWAEWRRSRGTLSSVNWWTPTAPSRCCWCRFCSSPQGLWLFCFHKPSRRRSPDVSHLTYTLGTKKFSLCLVWKQPPAAFCISFHRGFQSMCLI